VKEDDIFWLEMLYGDRGRTKHRERLEMQLDGRVDYLIAWHLVPVGHLLVMWEGCPDEPIAGMKEREPFLDDLSVLPAARKRGVGSTLIRAAEESIRERGFDRAAMTISINNPLSMMIHVKQGWSSAGIEPFVVNRKMTDSRGKVRIWSARVEYLVKDLRQGQDAD
jgi:GNAT superfamily N-acetyltransferase